MTCEEAVKQLYEYLDKELDPSSSAQIDKHLDLCRLCCSRFEFELSMKNLIHENCFQDRAPSLLKEKILRQLSHLD